MAHQIDRVLVTHLQVPLRDSPALGGESKVVLRDVLLVVLETADGLVGVGECSPPLGQESATSACWSALSETMLPPLLGRPIDGVADIPQLLAHARGSPAAALAGVETAAWDLVGHLHSSSLASLLGASEARIAVGVEPSVGFGVYPTVVDLLRAIEPHHQEGIRAFNIGVTPGCDFEFVAAVAQHFPRCAIGIDCGGRFCREYHDALRRIDELDPVWIERPYADDDLDGLVALQEALVNPICLDATAFPAIERGACRMARLQVQAAGGLTAARRLHDELEQRDIACRVDTTPELGIGLASAIALAALPNCKDPSGLAPTARWFLDDIVKPPIELDTCVPARFRVPTLPGVGHVIDWPRVHQHTVRQREWHTNSAEHAI
jgi:O-succinylbenzoate synthase